jgi:transcriptional regulator with XRE-family HTH domain
MMQRQSISAASAAKSVKERTLPIDKDVFAERLWSAIKRSGLTYKETARRAQEHLPPGARISDVSVWSYAKGRSLPRRMTHVEALSKVLGLETEELVSSNPRIARHTDAGAGGEDYPDIHIEDLGDGNAFVRIAQPVPWSVAVEVLRLIKGAGEDELPMSEHGVEAVANGDFPRKT